MAGIKWTSVLAVTVVLCSVIQLSSAAPQRDNSLDGLNPLSIEVSWVLSCDRRGGIGNFEFRSEAVVVVIDRLKVNLFICRCCCCFKCDLKMTMNSVWPVYKLGFVCEENLIEPLGEFFLDSCWVYLSIHWHVGWDIVCFFVFPMIKLRRETIVTHSQSGNEIVELPLGHHFHFLMQSPGFKLNLNSTSVISVHWHKTQE